MQRLIFDYHPAFFLLCAAVGAVYAWLLYSARHSWGPGTQRLLTFLRFVLVTLLAFLLLGPILRSTTNEEEKPTIVMLVDNSASMAAKADTAAMVSELKKVTAAAEESGKVVLWRNLNEGTDTIRFNARKSDLSGAIKQTLAATEGKNLAALVLVSDGIYNNGMSPAYLPVKVPVMVMGMGDTTTHADVVLREVSYNRIVYQGNKFSVRAGLDILGLPDTELAVTISQKGKLIHRELRNTGTRQIMDIDFQLEAAVQGIQRYEIAVSPAKGETNLSNNRATIFIEVVEGKKKILILAAAPHPDIKAMRSVIEKGSNYEVMLHIPGISEAGGEWLKPDKVDLVIAHQSPDLDGKTAALLTSFIKGKSAVLVIVGQRTNLKALESSGIPVAFEPQGQRDEVQPVLNASFRDFGFPEDLNTQLNRFPPVLVPFGKFRYPPHARVLLHQRIGSTITDRPLLMVWEEGQQKTGLMAGEGAWQWRLSEYESTEKTIYFDELFSRTIQYLSTRDDRKRFRCFPVRQEFSDDEAVTFESQVYNELFEPVYGDTITLNIRNEQGKVQPFRFVTGAGNTRYRPGILPTGVYQYDAVTRLNGVRQEVKGEFLVTEQNQESMVLMADFGLLRGLARNAGGKFYTADSWSDLTRDVQSMEVPRVIHTEEEFIPLLDIKWVFALLLALVSLEWFIRKYAGSY